MSILNKEENKRDTIVDRVFRKALQEFHMQLISSYSVLMKVRPLRLKVLTLLTNHHTFLLMLTYENKEKYNRLRTILFHVLLFFSTNILGRQVIYAEVRGSDGTV